MKERKIGLILSYISIALSTIGGLFLTPMIIKYLGDSEYGVYVLVGSFSSYLLIINSALSDTTVRYLVNSIAKKNLEEEKNIMGIMFYINLLLGISVFFIGIYIYKRIPIYYGESLSYFEIKLAQKMLIILLFNLFTLITLNVFQGGLIAHQKFIFLRGLDVCSEIVSFIVTFSILILRYKALGVVIVSAFLQILSSLLRLFFYIYKIGWNINLKPVVYKNELKEMTFYTIPLLGVIVAEQIFWKLDNILIAFVSGTTLIAVYSIGMSFHKYFMRFSTVISKIMMPKMIHEVDSGCNLNQILENIIKVSRIQAIILMLVLSGLIIFGNEFIKLWVGDGYGDSYIIILFTLIPYSLELIGNIRNVILQAKGLYWKKTIILLVISLVNIVLTIFLLNVIGIKGAALSTGIGVLINYTSINFILEKDVGLNMMEYHRGLWSGILPVVLLMISIGYLCNFYLSSSWFLFFVKVIIFTIIYIINMWIFALNNYEKKLIKSIFS